MTSEKTTLTLQKSGSLTLGSWLLVRGLARWRDRRHILFVAASSCHKRVLLRRSAGHRGEVMSDVLGESDSPVCEHDSWSTLHLEVA